MLLPNGFNFASGGIKPPLGHCGVKPQ